MPDGVVVVEMMPPGYPNEKPAVPKRKELSEAVFKKKYGGR